MTVQVNHHHHRRSLRHRKRADAEHELVARNPGFTIPGLDPLPPKHTPPQQHTPRT